MSQQFDENQNPLERIAEAVNGKIEWAARLPDGSGCGVISFALPQDHWLYQKNSDGFGFPPPMPFRLGMSEDAHRFVITREEFSEKIRQAGRYAIRASTDHGAEMDFDPDAMLQNLVVGMLGYHTIDGWSRDPEANPTPDTIAAEAKQSERQNLGGNGSSPEVQGSH